MITTVQKKESQYIGFRWGRVPVRVELMLQASHWENFNPPRGASVFRTDSPKCRCCQGRNNRGIRALNAAFFPWSLFALRLGGSRLLGWFFFSWCHGLFSVLRALSGRSGRFGWG